MNVFVCTLVVVALPYFSLRLITLCATAVATAVYFLTTVFVTKTEIKIN